MPSTAEQTKRELLRAARQEFAEHGLAGARVNRIAATAGINKERIYGYFGSKDGLFGAVLAQAMVEAAAGMPVRNGDTPAAYAARTFDFHRNNPDLLRLLMWEALSQPVETALSDPERKAHYDRKVEAFVAAGLDENDARFTLLVVLALATYTAAFPQVAGLILGPDQPAEELRSRLVDTISRLTWSSWTG